jgi:hypothetical protein
MGIMAIRPMATAFSYGDIDQLQHVNNIPIEEVEARARPGAYAFSGFIGKNERFKEVLKKDWSTVQALDCTHIELAQELRNIWNKGEGFVTHSFNHSRIGWTDRLSFRLGILLAAAAVAAAVVTPFALLGLIPAAFLICVQKTVLYVVKERCRGIQQDLFAPANSYSGWNGEMLVINPLNGSSVRVGEGIIDYIEKYGFYEGGENNAYRVDPVNLVSVLSGAAACAIRPLPE